MIAKNWKQKLARFDVSVYKILVLAQQGQTLAEQIQVKYTEQLATPPPSVLSL